MDSISVLLCIPGKENAALNLFHVPNDIYVYKQSRCHNPLVFNDIKQLIYNYYALEKYLYGLKKES